MKNEMWFGEHTVAVEKGIPDPEHVLSKHVLCRKKQGIGVRRVGELRRAEHYLRMDHHGTGGLLGRRQNWLSGGPQRSMNFIERESYSKPLGVCFATYAKFHTFRSCRLDVPSGRALRGHDFERGILSCGAISLPEKALYRRLYFIG
jgi:hypothetical protein